MIFTVREPKGFSMLMSDVLVVLVERTLPFLPPALSVASRIMESRSIRPALRRAVEVIPLPPGICDWVERDIAVNSFTMSTM